jgi:hypothetical protein
MNIHIPLLISDIIRYDASTELIPQYSECIAVELTCYRYVDLMGLEEPTDNIGTLLIRVAVKLGRTQRKRDISGKSLY